MDIIGVSIGGLNELKCKSWSILNHEHQQCLVSIWLLNRTFIFKSIFMFNDSPNNIIKKSKHVFSNVNRIYMGRVYIHSSPWNWPQTKRERVTFVFIYYLFIFSLTLIKRSSNLIFLSWQITSLIQLNSTQLNWDKFF